MIELELPVFDREPSISNNRTTTPLPQNALRAGQFNAPRTLYVETYGCQMNISDSEIVKGIMNENGYAMTDTPDNADVILLNTCAIRDNAERKIHERLNHLKFYKKRRNELVIGVLGCMAERMRTQLVDEKKIVDVIVGPDEYRSLPHLVDKAFGGEKGIAVKLSRVETYDDITPLRTEGLSAWISVMRGCDKFCSFCVVPFTRGRERSRALQLIVEETRQLWERGLKEVTFLGQNVNSYHDESTHADFADLLETTAKVVPQMRIRYTTSHPYDMSDKLIQTMASYENICHYIHLPVQSGSNKILTAMNRHYSVEHYIERLQTIKRHIPGCALSTDIIVGFPGETEEDHELTLELMRQVRYDGAYMFKYSPRERTKAWNMTDDVPEEVKTRRLNEIIALQQEISLDINRKTIGTLEQVLVEGPSKRRETEWQGRTNSNKVVIFPHLTNSDTARQAGYIVGDTIQVRIERVSSATLFGSVVE